MKELSIEEKAKRYDEAKARMSRAYNDNRCTIGFMNEIFPELKESENERVRKELIAEVKEQIDCIPAPDCRDKEDEKALKKLNKWLAWLEKQGEQKTVDEIAKEVCKNKTSAMAFLKSAGIMNEKGELAEQYRQGEQNPADKVEPKFKVGQTIKKEGFNLGFTIVKIEDGFYYNDVNDNFPFTDQDNWELVEQNPAWSEEDEEILEALNDYVKNLDILFSEIKIGDKDILSKEFREKVQHWLKSLKERVQPQPKQE